MALISHEELFYYFLYDKNRYGENNQCWPRKTILLCRCEVMYMNGPTVVTSSPLGGQWLRLDSYKNIHAEIRMIEYLQNNIIPGYCVHLSVILTYSPCNVCANALSSLKSKYPGIVIEIKFANFYKCSNKLEENNNISGLCQLFYNDIRLGIFYGLQDWNSFIHCVLGLVSDIYSLKMLTDARSKREDIDLYLIQCIELYSINYGCAQFNPMLLLPVASAWEQADAQKAALDMEIGFQSILPQPNPYVFNFCPPPPFPLVCNTAM